MRIYFCSVLFLFTVTAETFCCNTVSDQWRCCSSQRPSLLRRVCRLALPLWLLLVALLLLLLRLLPFVDQAHSCSNRNNFASSFNFMLRYQGPPPT